MVVPISPRAPQVLPEAKKHRGSAARKKFKFD
nr:MAG TPA: hypothetical protein [Caudoviricetes sp.]